MTRRFSLFLTLPLILLCACKEKGEVHHTRVKKSAPTHATQKTAPPVTSAKAPYRWTLPEGWIAKPASGMRLATIVIPTPGTSLEAAIFELGGNTSSNVNRWRQQLALNPLPENEILGTLEEINTGLGKAYIVPLTNPASPDKALLAAIIPRPGGTSIFIKITATSAELKTIADPFRQFVKSFSSHE